MISKRLHIALRTLSFFAVTLLLPVLSHNHAFAEEVTYPEAATEIDACYACGAVFREAATASTDDSEKLMPLAPAFDDSDSTGDYMLGELVVTARRENESLDDPPVFVEIINMDKQVGRMITTEEVVGQATGVNVREFGGLGSASSVSIRGSSSDQIVVLLDGIRLNPSGGGGVDLSTIPAEHIAGIEVIRGGDSAFYGDGALGGVINIKTRKPTDRPLTTIGLGYGSFDTYRASLTNSLSVGALSYLISGAYLNSAGNFEFTNNNGTEENDADDFSDTRQNNDYTAYSLLFKADYEPASALRLTAHNEFFRAERGVPGMITFPSPHVRESDLRNSSSLTLEANDLTALALTSITRLSFRYGLNEFKDSYGEMTGAVIDSRRVDYSPTFAESLRFFLGEAQVLTLSGEYRIDSLHDSDFSARSRYNFALGARDRIYLFSDSLILVPALRYDRISSVGERASPKLGLALWLTDWLVAKGNVGESFRAPALDELYYDHGYVVGNPDLKPETAINYDLGLQVQSEMLFFEGAYYHSKVRNLIEYVLVSGFRYKPFNIGEVDLSGVELSGRFSPVKYFSASGNYTLTYAIDRTDEFNRRGNQVPGRPRHKAFVRLEGLIDDFLSPFLEYHYIGSNYVTTANTKLIDQRRLYNCGLLAQLGERFKLGGEVKNLTDDRALDVRGFPLPGRSFNLTLQTKL